MGIKANYEQRQRDYEYLVAHHGEHADDLTGGFVEGDELFRLLKNPCKKLADEIYWSLITHSAVCGFENGVEPDLEDDEVCEIYRRNCCESEILRSWGVDLEENE